MAGRKRGKMIKAFAFLFVLSIGVLPLSTSYNDGTNIYIRMENEGMLHYKDTIVLLCCAEGIDEPYVIYWQYMDPNEEIPEWRSLNYSGGKYEFILTPENVDYYYRVIVVRGDDQFNAQSNII